MGDLARLRRRDPGWDYSGEFTKRYTHGLHTYPAMMIPQVAARLIEQYSAPDSAVLDPFCGSGSVLVEARALGRNAWGIDLNPLATLIARVKTTPIEQSILERGLGLITDALPRLMREPPTPPPIPRLAFWFKPKVIAQLSALKAAIATLDDRSLREFFLIAFSEVARLASNTRSSEFKLYRYPPERLALHEPDAISLFRERTRRNIEAMGPFAAACSLTVWTRILLANSQKLAAEIVPRSVDAVVTSPPYGDSRTTVAYGQFSRLSAQWLELWDEGDLDRDLLGGRKPVEWEQSLPSASLRRTVAAVAAVDSDRAQEVLAFYLDLGPCLTHVSRCLRPGGHACIVIGNRRVKRVIRK